ncbi:MAG: winged helix-turn-helix transcriptional regulator [Saprospiraceae bacterium]|nr:winged helix-turn-helix transcriptional regulator [Saprospiraceae bacterium]
MGASKTEHYTERQNSIAMLAKAIGHPARVAIIDYLLKKDQCICNDIVDELPLSQPTISQHLKELKTAGLIKGNIDGNSICYCINQITLQKLVSYLENISQKITNRNKCC